MKYYEAWIKALFHLIPKLTKDEQKNEEQETQTEK
jgi:hypothetical protein